MTFPTTCGACATMCETRMFVTSILIILELWSLGGAKLIRQSIDRNQMLKYILKCKR